jgi:hypothetical protein
LSASDDLTERYEYAPYGQRTVFKPSRNDDATTASYGDHMCMAPIPGAPTHEGLSLNQETKNPKKTRI